MRQGKSPEAEETGMEENKRIYNWKYYLAELGVLILGTAGVWALGRIRGEVPDRLLGNCVMALFGLAVTGFQFRREYLKGALDYDNGEHGARFWFFVVMGLLTALLCGALLPVGGWPFLAVFLALALFSNMSTGIVASVMLLLIAVLISGCGMGGFFLYLVSGVFGIALFQHLEADFRIGIPLFLSVLCLMVCEMANVILVAEKRPDMELFMIPVANLIVNGVLLLGCLRLFFAKVIYRYQGKYLELNDTGNPVLVELKQHNKSEYLHSVHTAYFCERIAKRLGLDADALKCAGYYYCMGEGLEKMMGEKGFPPAAGKILEEYMTCRKRVRNKETAVLICCDAILASVLLLYEKEPSGKVDFDRMIDDVFDKFLRDGSFDHCNLTLEELCVMQSIFKEEKLYYGFLR